MRALLSGIKGDVHDWFKSYLSDRTQYVNINGVLSDTKKLTFGIPLYCLYTKPVFFCRFGLSYPSYADDT